jgi:2-polyprenyl-3-methyl-5-hydroxy-6-metoxy-1,4-benzoquinol methylase
VARRDKQAKSAQSAPVAEKLMRSGIAIDTEEIVSEFPRADLAADSTSQARYAAWRAKQNKSVEYLLPRIVREISGTWPEYMGKQKGHLDLSPDELAKQVEALGPWYVPFKLGHDVGTINFDLAVAQRNVENYLYRRDLICQTVAEVLGDDLASTTVLDIGCNSGFFSLDLAARGAKHVDGVDLRDENIQRAKFVAEHFGFDNAEFRVSDADALAAGGQWDVILNLGVLYHVVNPLQFIRQTYELCSRFAIIDTVCHIEAVSAYFLFGDKNTTNPTEGREEWEFHPTYRGAIDTIRYAGFSDVIEIVGHSDPPHPLYSEGLRRCFLAVK